MIVTVLGVTGKFVGTRNPNCFVLEDKPGSRWVVSANSPIVKPS